VLTVSYRAGLVLTHGAGASKDSPLLVAIAQSLEEAGILAERYNLPFRERKSSGPPTPASAAEDRAGLREQALAMRARVNGPVILGGHSYGGRQASMLLAEDASLADALLLLSYPLHPPNKPEQPRTAHFSQLKTPALFVHGTKDPFGTIAELEAAMKLISGRTALSTVDRAGHDLARGKFDREKFILKPLNDLLATNANSRATGVS
jgi:predicted alpha/beta-hydrolase family hydrolase